MSALSIQPTYPIFTDIDGQPLEAGYVWIGTANLDPQTNPINVYWDAALTLLAAQPIRTLAGYPANSGAPARLYVNSDYSIRVMNKNGSAVYSAPTATERYSGVVINGVNAEDVIYDPPFFGGVQTNVEEKLAQTVSVKDFGAVGDGVTDDTTAIQNAISSGAKQIHFAGGTYNLGTLNASSTLFSLNNADNVRFVADGTVTFSFAFADNGTQPVLFGFTGCDSIRFDGNFAFNDSVGYNGGAITGVKAFKLNDTNTNFTFENVTFTGVLSGIEVAGTIDSRSVKQISANITATNVYYVLNCMQNGDDVVANIKATGCRREYFVYGVRNHRVKLTIIDKDTNNSSLIASYEYTNKTEDIDVDATVIWSGSPSRNFIALQHAPNTASGVTAGIRNVNIRYNIYAGSASASSTIGAVELTAAINGGAAISANCNCVTDKITISGRTNGFYVYDVYSRYTLTSGNAKGEAYWPVNAKFSLDALKVLHHTKTYTWTPVLSGTGWSLGNGTAEGNYTLLGDGDSMFVWGKFTFGTTSTYNNGASPNVTLPAIPYPWAGEGSFNTGHPSTLTMVGMANLWDSSAGNAGYYDIPVKISGATGTVFLAFHGNGGFLLGNNPFAWDTGDTIQFFAHVIHNNTQQLAP